MVRIFFLFFLIAWLIADGALWITQLHDISSAIQLTYLTTAPTITLCLLAIATWRSETS